MGCGDPVCPAGNLVGGKAAGHTIRWVWSLALCMGTPYVLTSLQALWTLCFKRKRKPVSRVLMVVGHKSIGPICKEIALRSFNL